MTHREQENSGVELSIVVPLYNEEDNIEPLYERLTEALTKIGRTYELVLVDDGSIDETETRASAIAQRDSKVRFIRFRRNFGQTAALMAGFDHSRGKILITIDGDGQNDPADIGSLLEHLNSGFDVVSGWRVNRREPYLRRILPSKVANWLISWLFGVKLHDYGCTLKAYQRDVLSGVRMYGEMHRFIPILASGQGARVTEIPVRHSARWSGQSNYGVERTIKVILDLMVIGFLERFLSRPIYVFGGIGLLSVVLAFIAGLTAIYLRLGEGTSFIETPLPLLVALLLIVGTLCLLMGMLAEMIMRVYYESQGAPPYVIKRTINISED